MRKILFAYLLFLFLFPIYTVVVLDRDPSIIDELALIAFGGIVLVNNLLRSNFKIHILFGAFSILYFYSLLLNFFIGIDFIFSVKSIYYSYQFVIYIYIMSSIKMSFNDYKKLFHFFEVIFFVICLIGLVDWSFDNQILSYAGYERHGRYGLYRLRSVFAHPVSMGWLSAVFCLYYTFRFFGNYTFNKKHSNIINCKLLFSIIILVLTNSRKSWISFIIVSFVFMLFYYYPYFNYRKKTKLIVNGILLVSLFLILANTQLRFYYDVTKEDYVDKYDEVARVMLYVVGFKIVVDRFPFGVGVGKFGGINSTNPYSEIYYEYDLSNIWGLTPHKSNFITDGYWHKPIGELGFLGISLYFFLFAYLIRKLSKKIDFIKNYEYSIFAVFSLGILILTIIEGVFAANFTDNFFTFFAIGLPVLLITIKHDEKKE